MNDCQVHPKSTAALSLNSAKLNFCAKFQGIDAMSLPQPPLLPPAADVERRPSPTFIRRGSLAGKSALSALARTAAARANGAAPKSRSTDV